jgi:rhodanese-related sulfurtransferase
MDVSTSDTARALEDGSALVVDVREQHERDAGHIEGTRHIALGRLTEEAATIPRDRPVIFYCHSGARSTMAADAFAAAGYDATSMAGGISAWADEGRPLAPEGASVVH